MGTQSASVYWSEVRDSWLSKNWSNDNLLCPWQWVPFACLLNSNKILQKKRAIVSYSQVKCKASVPYKSTIWTICKVQFTPWIEFLFFEDLIFWKVNCRIKSWAEDASVCKSKPGGDSDFGILMRKESYGEPTDGEDRSAERSKAIGQAEMMWTFLSKPAQGPIHVNPITPEKSNLTAHFPAAWEGVPRR